MSFFQLSLRVIFECKSLYIILIYFQFFRPKKMSFHLFQQENAVVISPAKKSTSDISHERKHLKRRNHKSFFRGRNQKCFSSREKSQILFSQEKFQVLFFAGEIRSVFFAGENIEVFFFSREK